MRRIGILAISHAESIDVLLAALARLGWVAGKTIEIVFPSPSGDDAKLACNMREILAAKVDLIVAQTRPAVFAAREATSRVPVVMGAFNGDPVKEGIAKSVQHPGGNVTGTYYDGNAAARQRVTLVRELLPNTQHLGILMNPLSKVSMGLAEDLAETARGMGLSARLIGAGRAEEVDEAFASAAALGLQAVATVSGADMYSFRKNVVSAADKYRLPTIMGSIGFPELGGLAKIGPDIPILWRKMAKVIKDAGIVVE